MRNQLSVAGSPDTQLAQIQRSAIAGRREHVLAVLGHCGGNRSEAARVLGLHRKTLQRWLTAWGIAPSPQNGKVTP